MRSTSRTDAGKRPVFRIRAEGVGLRRGEAAGDYAGIPDLALDRRAATTSPSRMTANRVANPPFLARQMLAGQLAEQFAGFRQHEVGHQLLLQLPGAVPRMCSSVTL